MAKIQRKIICIAKRGANRCGNYLGDMPADVDGEATFRPCQQCHISWKIIQNNGLLTYLRVDKDDLKKYDEDTLITEEAGHAEG